MQKKVLLIPLMIFLCSCAFNTKAIFNISVGDEFQYDVKKWNWEAISGSNSSSAHGFTIDNHHFDEGEDFLIKVLAMEDNFSASYRIKKDEYSIDKDTSGFGAYLYLLMIVQAPTGYVLPHHPWNETRIQQGPLLEMILHPFYDTDSSNFDYFEQTANSSYISSQMTATWRNYSDLQITYEEKKDKIFIERYANYDYQYNNENYTYDSTTIYNILFSIKLSTGVLQGFRFRCSQIGLLNGTNFEFNSELHLELKGYNLPNFSLGEYAGLPGFSFYFVPITLMILGMLRFLIKKRRNKY